MRCRGCDHLSPAGSRFCEQCGSNLAEPASCPSCGAALRSGQRFCNQCGAALTAAAAPARASEATEAAPVPAAAPATEPAPEPRERRAPLPGHLADKVRGAAGGLEGERKLVTVLFADVMDSMQLAERTDPEDWQGIMDRFFAKLADGVHRFEGTVDKFTGDGIMAIFGAPIAHEDHARRACLAALHLRDELGAFAAELRRTHALNFLVRMGINSGEVVVGRIGDDLSLEYTAIGHTVGLAQRMESLAEPGKPYLTQGTADLVAGFMELRDLGEFRVKGATEPMSVYELAGIGSARGRLDLSRARGFSRFVGRAEEIAALEAALERALEGEGQAVGIVGEAGVGKSRLCHEFAERCRERGITVFEAQGQAHAQSVPFLPVLQVLRSYFGVEEEDSDQEAREKVAGRLLLLDEGFGDDLPLLFDFLAVPDPERQAPSVNPEARQRRLLGLVKRLVVANSRREPVVQLFEDLHWLDPGSAVFLGALLDAIPGTRHLTVLNFRPEYSAEWMRRSYYRQMPLAPLGPEAISELLRDLLGDDPSLNGLPDLIRERTAGNPFFIEEVVRELAEVGNLEGDKGAYRLVRPVEGATVPATVQTILAARIDRLAEREKSVLQAASVIGPEFPEPVLTRVVAANGDLDAALRGLVSAEFVYEAALYPEAEYAFKHPLTQEVAYGSQLSERRASTHAAVAQAIEELHPEGLDERAALLAHHYERAGEELEAARWHARAAQWAGYSGPAEAVQHWRRVRELAIALPQTPETVGLGNGSRIMILQFAWRLGLPDEEVAAVFEEGRALAERSGDDGSLSALLGMYATVRGLRGDVDEYVTLSSEAVEIAERLGEPALIVPPLAAASYALLTKGRYQEALERLERIIGLADENRTLGAGLGVGNPYAWAVAFRAFALAFLGRIGEAGEEVERGIELARRYGDDETRGWAHMLFVNIARLGGETDGVLAHATHAVEIAERIGDGFSRALAQQWLGVAHLIEGRPGEAAAAFERSLAIARERGTGLEYEPFCLSMLARAVLESDEADRALAYADQAVELAQGRGLEAIAGGCRRTRAQVLLRTGTGSDAQIEADLMWALDHNRLLGARGEETETRVGLAELARRRGDESGRRRELEEAHALASEMGAEGWAKRLEAELAAAAGARSGGDADHA